MQNTFLRGDGKWVTIENPEGSNLTADEKSVSITNEVIILKDYSLKDCSKIIKIIIFSNIF